MEIKKDIESPADIKRMVDEFYTGIQSDQLLSPIFLSRIKDDWEPHLQKMYQFWQTILFDQYTYKGSPFPPHSNLPINKEHFDRWLLLFYSTVDKYFAGEKANEAKWRATKMAEMFLSKIEFYRNSNTKPLL